MTAWPFGSHAQTVKDGDRAAKPCGQVRHWQQKVRLLQLSAPESDIPAVASMMTLSVIT